jgi:hypothetical protein
LLLRGSRFGNEENNGEVNNDVEDNPDEVRSFPLFGRNEITADVAAYDGADLFACRVSAFDSAMRSSWEHFKLKDDIVEHVYAKFHNANN